MSTMKKIFEVLEIIKLDPGRSATELAVELEVIPVVMGDWLEILRNDGMIEPRHANDGNGIEGWYILPGGEATITWMYYDAPTEEM